MEKKKILLDVDDVICESVYLQQFNKFFGTNYSINEFKDFHLEDNIQPEERKFAYLDYVFSVDIYENTILKPDCYEIMQKLSEIYDIYICSACIAEFYPVKCGMNFKFKYDFLLRTFPFLDPAKIIFANHKNLICGDVQIDDRPSNLENNNPIRLLFTAYHNRLITDEELKEKGLIRVDTWKDIEKILLPNHTNK